MHVLQVDDGLVEYNFLAEIPGNKKPQIHIYDTCLQDYGARHTWMSFTDADEFFVLRNDSLPELPVLLRGFEQYGALVVNWQVGTVTSQQFPCQPCWEEHTASALRPALQWL